MTKKSYLYATAHLHCVDLMEEVSKIIDAPPELMLLLANAAGILARAQAKAFNDE